MQKLGRVFAVAAGLLTLLAPSAAFGSWWDGGYSDKGYSDKGYSDKGYSDKGCPDKGYSDKGCPDRRHSDGYRGEPIPIGSLYGCENSTLPGTGVGLVKTTTPPPGTPVRPGDEILVDIRWRVSDWAGPDLHKAIDCVYINGVFVPGLSGGERPTPNDGHFAFRYLVPLDLRPGATICDQGFVSGPNGHDDYAREVSNVVCFPIETPPPPPPPPPCCVKETTTTTTPPPPTTTTTVPEAQPYGRFEQAGPGDTGLTPTAPIVKHRDVLPRTGADAGGAARFAAAALAVAIATGRLRRNRS